MRSTQTEIKTERVIKKDLYPFLKKQSDPIQQKNLRETIKETGVTMEGQFGVDIKKTI